MFYTVNDKEYSSDSTPNQKILDQLINREVFCNMNQEMDFILSALAYDASIPEDPPFDESDYESAICDASSQTCSECGNSSYFDEVHRDKRYLSSDIFQFDDPILSLFHGTHSTIGFRRWLLSPAMLAPLNEFSSVIPPAISFDQLLAGGELPQ